ncbi:hypothetical protein WA026_016548 [Henosepilachna vigintioctopunctata]|uniref:Uncharacterized protein n=1 Tax=Henosepilachna vigintioctopunctata TaxID=420089 RepID=A0AAW1VGJ0_9CUCU
MVRFRRCPITSYISVVDFRITQEPDDSQHYNGLPVVQETGDSENMNDKGQIETSHLKEHREEPIIYTSLPYLKNMTPRLTRLFNNALKMKISNSDKEAKLKMKCVGCGLEGDKYVLFACDGCGNLQCKECGNYTATEEKCFPLSKRRAILLCLRCREETGNITELIENNRKLTEENKSLKNKLALQSKIPANSEHNKVLYENKILTESRKKMKDQIQALEKKITKLQHELTEQQKVIHEYNLKTERTDDKIQLEARNKQPKPISNCSNANNPDIDQQKLIHDLFSSMEEKINFKLQNINENFNGKITQLRKELNYSNQSSAKSYRTVDTTRTLKYEKPTNPQTKSLSKTQEISSSRLGLSQIANMERTLTQDKVRNSNPKKSTNRNIRSSIFGSGQSLNIKVVKTFTHFHVCKIEPGLQEEQLRQYLESAGFDDVKCSKLESRRPLEYSSFKVSVPRENMNKVENAEGTSATNLKPSRQNSQLSNSCKATSSNQRMKIMHFNIQGVTNKIEALENPTSHLKTDVICLSEHWLHEKNKGLYQMENRRLASGYNRQQHQHGGVCIYINEGILYSEISEIKNFSNEMTNEVCAIYLSEQNLVVLSFYAAKNIEIFKRSLLEEDWHEVINMKNANKKFEVFLNIFCLQLNNCCPLRSFTQSRKFDYYRSLHHMKLTLDLIREAYLKNKDENTLTLFKIDREQYLEAAQVERRIRNENKIAAAENKQKATWQIINNETGRSKKVT